MKADFIPKRDGDLNSFEENILTKLPNHAAVLGISQDELAEFRSIVEAHKNEYTALVLMRAQSKAATERNKIRKTAAVDELRRMAARVKAGSSYNDSIGDDLGIIGAETPAVIKSALKPVLKLRNDGNDIVASFRKNGAHGIKLYCRRGDESVFTLIATYIKSPYRDDRPALVPGKPETREYYARYFENDRDIGERSDSVKITLP